MDSAEDKVEAPEKTQVLDRDVLRLLQLAEQEIVKMRRRNEVLEAKVSVVEIFDRAITAQYMTPSIGYSEDVAWAISKRIAEHHIAKQEAASHGHS